jgi:hypothetical protein
MAPDDEGATGGNMGTEANITATMLPPDARLSAGEACCGIEGVTGSEAPSDDEESCIDTEAGLASEGQAARGNERLPAEVLFASGSEGGAP